MKQLDHILNADLLCLYSEARFLERVIHMVGGGGWCSSLGKYLSINVLKTLFQTILFCH